MKAKLGDTGIRIYLNGEEIPIMMCESADDELRNL